LSPGSTAGKHRDWYKISVDTLRGWGIFLLLLLAAGAGYVGFRAWERYAIQREAAHAIDDARVLFQRLRSDEKTTEKVQHRRLAASRRTHDRKKLALLYFE